MQSPPRHNRTQPVKGKINWDKHLVSIINANKTRHAFKDKTVSTRTMEHRHQVLFQSFKELRDECGFKIDNPRNFRETHFIALATLWVSKGLKPPTIQGKTTVMRVFCTWIGRPNMIKPLEHYIDVSLVKRTQVAQVDKSWKGNDVSYQDILKKIDAYDERAGAQMRVIKAFGLRREEAVCFQPIRAMKLGEDKQSIFVEKGTKNGLKRYVPIDSDEKREALAFACAVAKVTDGHIGWHDRSLKQAVKKMANIMAKFGITKKDLGVTLHGLRHERMHDIHEEVTGQPCAVRGGIRENVDPDLELKARHKMTMEAGHAWLGIANAYAGSFNRQAQTKNDAAP